jgi:transcriptional regulator with XRE-family HTH domain
MAVRSLSRKFSRMLLKPYVKYARHVGVSGRHESLSEFVRRIAAERNLKYREIARRSGNAISHATVGEIINNPNKTVTVDTLKALAEGLDVPYSLLAGIAFGQHTETAGDEQLENELTSLRKLFGELPTDERAYGLRLLETVRFDLKRRAGIARSRTRVRLVGFDPHPDARTIAEKTKKRRAS